MDSGNIIGVQALRIPCKNMYSMYMSHLLLVYITYNPSASYDKSPGLGIVKTGPRPAHS